MASQNWNHQQAFDSKHCTKYAATNVSVTTCNEHVTIVLEYRQQLYDTDIKSEPKKKKNPQSSAPTPELTQLLSSSEHLTGI